MKIPVIQMISKLDKEIQKANLTFKTNIESLYENLLVFLEKHEYTSKEAFWVLTKASFINAKKEKRESYVLERVKTAEEFAYYCEKMQLRNK